MRQFTREFNKKLQADFGYVDFIFNSIEGRRYLISVRDKDHNFYFFSMQAKGGKWLIIEKKLPAWILNLKQELSDAIIEHRGKYP